MVQWLRFGASTAGHEGSSPDQGTAAQPKGKIKNGWSLYTNSALGGFEPNLQLSRMSLAEAIREGRDLLQTNSNTIRRAGRATKRKNIHAAPRQARHRAKGFPHTYVI